MTTASAATSVSPTPNQVWSRFRGLLLAAAVLAASGVVIAAIRSGGEHGLLDPRSPDARGSRAVAALLEERGVDTEVVTTSTEARKAAGPGTTLLVTAPDVLSRHQRAELRTASQQGGRTVFVAPGRESVGTLAPGVRAAAPVAVQPTPPDCTFPAAERAGDAELGGVRYSVTADAVDACYVHQGLPSLLRLPAGPGNGSSRAHPEDDTVLLGAPDPLFNERLDEHGNASLMLQLLGSRPHLVWFLPSSVDSGTAESDDRGLFDLLPTGWSWATLQLGVAAVLAALWRMRRLGPLVPERLPVSVRASETTEGRARLYRRADARDRAAEALRSAARSRLAPLAGVSSAQAHSPETLTPAVAAHLPHPPADTPEGPASPNGEDAAYVHRLLFGAVPRNDADLIRLADDLDQLEHRFSPVTSDTRLPTDKERTS